MRELYERLIAEGEAGIDRLIIAQEQEFLELDFKRKENSSNGELSTNDRRMLAEALSGFANSAGGLLIVGVDARQGIDGIDCAQDARPITDIRRFLADTNTEIGRLVQPRLDGVSVAAIASDRLDGAGYLLVLVPRSDRRPHRSEAKGQKGYYRRAGSAFYEMEHYDIEDAFNRQQTPELQIYSEIRTKAHIFRGAETVSATFVVGLQNVSGYIARHPYLIIEPGYGVLLINEGAGKEPGRVSFSSNPNEHMFNSSSQDVIHPGLKMPVAVFRVSAREVMLDWLIGHKRSQEMVAEVKCRFACENAREADFTVSIRAQDLGFPG